MDSLRDFFGSIFTSKSSSSETESKESQNNSCEDSAVKTNTIFFQSKKNEASNPTKTSKNSSFFKTGDFENYCSNIFKKFSTLMASLTKREGVKIDKDVKDIGAQVRQKNQKT